MQALKLALGGVDMLNVSSLRQKVLEQCRPARAIVVEYALQSMKVAEQHVATSKFTAMAIARSGRRLVSLRSTVTEGGAASPSATGVPWVEGKTPSHSSYSRAASATSPNPT